MKKILLIIVVVIIIGGVYKIYLINRIDPKDPNFMGDNPSPVEIKQRQQETQVMVEAVAEKVLVAINNKDMGSFIKLVHPTKGVRFSKDGVVRVGGDPELTIQQIEDLILTNETMLWGYADGSGMAINETFEEHFYKYSKNDFLKAPQISYGEVLQPSGANISNISTIYNSYPKVSYHYPYTSTYVNDKGKEVAQTMSWKTLNLVFYSYDNEYYLIGIVEDNWTI